MIFKGELEPESQHEKDALKFIRLCGGGLLREYCSIPEGCPNVDFIIPEKSILIEYKRIESRKIIEKLNEVGEKFWASNEEYEKALEKAIKSSFRMVSSAAEQMKSTKKWIKSVDGGDRDWFSILMITNSEEKGNPQISYPLIKRMMQLMLKDRTVSGSQNSSIDAVLFTHFHKDSYFILDDGVGPLMSAAPFHLYHRDRVVSDERKDDCYNLLRFGYHSYLKERQGFVPMTVSTKHMHQSKIHCSMDTPGKPVGRKESSIMVFPNKPGEPDILFTSPSMLGPDGIQGIRKPGYGMLVFIEDDLRVKRNNGWSFIHSIWNKICVKLKMKKTEV